LYNDKRTNLPHRKSEVLVTAKLSTPVNIIHVGDDAKLHIAMNTTKQNTRLQSQTTPSLSIVEMSLTKTLKK